MAGGITRYPMECLDNLVSVIIPVYNRARLLREAVASVVGQTYRPVEIIIVDDGSTDDTGAAAEDLACKHDGLITVLHRKNGGPGLAREAGRQQARGEFIQYLDSDDILLPDKFVIQVRALRDNQECGVAYGKTRLVDGAGNILAEPFKLSGTEQPFLFPGLLVDRWWNTHTPLYRRSVCDAVGPWIDMRMGEDWEYDARVGALKTRLSWCSEYVSHHCQHQEGRLTGNELNRDVLRDIGRLIPRLYGCSQQAGVSHSYEEMRHFSRWAFLVARQAGQAGLSRIAEKCLDTARLADESGGRRLDLRIYRTMAAVLGWSGAGKMSCLVDSLLQRGGKR